MYTRSYAEAVTWLTPGRRRVRAPRRPRRACPGRSDRITFALYQQGAYDEALDGRRAPPRDGDRGRRPRRGEHRAQPHRPGAPGTPASPTEALALLQQALDTATTAGDRRCLLYAAANLALVHLRHGDHLQAVTHGRQAFEVAQEIGLPADRGRVRRQHGRGLPGRGRLRPGNPMLRLRPADRRRAAGLDQRRRPGGERGRHGGRPGATTGEAERLFARAIALARHLDAPYLLCGWLHRLAKLHVEQGRFEEAERLNQEALEVADRTTSGTSRSGASVLVASACRSRSAASAPTRRSGRLRALEGTWIEPHERALLLDALWQPRPDRRRRSGSAAADLYRQLYERTPSIEYREAYACLTGTTLPPGAAVAAAAGRARGGRRRTSTSCCGRSTRSSLQLGPRSLRALAGSSPRLTRPASTGSPEQP